MAKRVASDAGSMGTPMAQRPALARSPESELDNQRISATVYNSGRVSKSHKSHKSQKSHKAHKSHKGHKSSSRPKKEVRTQTCQTSTTLEDLTLLAKTAADKELAQARPSVTLIKALDHDKSQANSPNHGHLPSTGEPSAVEPNNRHHSVTSSNGHSNGLNSPTSHNNTATNSTAHTPSLPVPIVKPQAANAPHPTFSNSDITPSQPQPRAPQPSTASSRHQAVVAVSKASSSSSVDSERDEHAHQQSRDSSSSSSLAEGESSRHPVHHSLTTAPSTKEQNPPVKAKATHATHASGFNPTPSKSNQDAAPTSQAHALSRAHSGGASTTSHVIHMPFQQQAANQAQAQAMQAQAMQAQAMQAQAMQAQAMQVQAMQAQAMQAQGLVSHAPSAYHAPHLMQSNMMGGQHTHMQPMNMPFAAGMAPHQMQMYSAYSHPHHQQQQQQQQFNTMFAPMPGMMQMHHPGMMAYSQPGMMNMGSGIMPQHMTMSGAMVPQQHYMLNMPQAQQQAQHQPSQLQQQMLIPAVSLPAASATLSHDPSSGSANMVTALANSALQQQQQQQQDKQQARPRPRLLTSADREKTLKSLKPRLSQYTRKLAAALQELRQLQMMTTPELLAQRREKYNAVKTKQGICQQCLRKRILHTKWPLCLACIKHNSSHLKQFKQRFAIEPHNDLELYIYGLFLSTAVMLQPFCLPF
ncbi:uncharacterized protein MONBRDRAFT_30495 [Monosiga brevicollis MX1]|uniref:Uncharacterized protein n=1 Tax=Monosiga brevicollis TaxID=81824 RepID=A9VE31_MONBE|nr:uncharacterized protein MONBRDRAFT_30495 [Monosiga brevicollis MX1]EDQ84194.1 predicted protein [Monosiga brevicollis MX1]|eukprot:XP_001750982.1 hypothetical protein [Monosiga brevicollis MX1]